MAQEFDKPRTFETLDALSRTRALTETETMRLERLVRRSCPRNETWHWSKGDDGRLRRYLGRGKKPKQIAILMGRTEGAIWKRMMRLRLKVLVRGKVQLPPSPESGNS